MDNQRIGVTPKRLFCVRTMLDHHAMDKEAIWNALCQRHDGPTVIMTHHIPIRQLVHPSREFVNERQRALCAAFASDLWAEIRGFDRHTWRCGHSRDNESWTGRGKHGAIRFVMNGRGYPGEGAAFDPAFVFEV